MAIRIKTKRLKIVEQIAIVLFFAVVIPMTISGIIINNINQQSIRTQLKVAAELIANMVSDEIDVFQNTAKNELKQIIVSLNHIDEEHEKQNYIKSILKYSNIYKDIVIVNNLNEFEKIHSASLLNQETAINERLNNGKYLVAIFDLKELKEQLFTPLTDDKRQIYVTTHSGKLLTSYNYNEKIFNQTLKLLPQDQKENESVIFGKRKNQPFVYLKKDNPKVTIIVNTPKEMTRATIEYGRTKIILSVLIASLTVLFIVGLYTYYLYINIRQLFKAIIAISKGNYRRRIRLLSSVFTPFEIMFLAFEFNRMIKQINKSYSKLKKTNKELKDLNEFRSNMIDTVSHEFRTPLTSIQGYTSRLLRQDIQIDKETQYKSLKVIKKQSERLKRMIEDLLVIPDIEDARLNVIIEEVSLNNIVTDSILLVKNASEKTIINNINENIPQIYADRDRLEQVIINLIENAVKYGTENTPITINAGEEKDRIFFEVQNEYPVIPKEKLKTLFEKFTRIDDSTTRTTRGTGLGLYIVKGLVEAMSGDVKLYSSPETGFSVKIFFDKVQ